MGRINKANGFDLLSDTIFVKDFTEKNKNLNKLKDLLNKTDDFDLKNKISKDIKLMKCGLEGENKVYFELKNSLLPMLCLHDIRIKVDNKVAQIDFLIITNKFIYIIETKHLVGDIRVNECGDFIRVIKDTNGKVIREEGMYSPVTQGQRHARLLEKLLADKNILNIPQFPIKSIAVLANPKTIIDIKSKNVSHNICRCDKLVNFIESELLNLDYDLMLSDSKIRNIADAILKEDCPILFDYESKYFKNNYINIKSSDNSLKIPSEQIATKTENTKKLSYDNYNELSVTFSDASVISNSFLNINSSNNNNNNKIKVNNNSVIDFKKSEKVTVNDSLVNNSKSFDKPKHYKLTKDQLEKQLKHYRYNKAIETGLPIYDIFNNKEMKKILDANPSSIKELIEIEKLSSNLIINYGNDILSILHPEIYTSSNICNTSSNSELESKLREYRASVSKKENTPTYLIFTNNELDRVIQAKPLTIENLAKIKGFETKANRYGNDIINIISSVI